MLNIKRNYSLIPVVVFGFAALGSFFSESGMDWYTTLVLPQGTPSGELIGIIWTVIYVCVMLSLLIFWNRVKHTKRFWWIIWLFVLNGILNAVWNWVFFGQHWLGLAFWWMIVLLVITLIKIILIWPKHRLASILLWIYPLWVTLASVFAWKIWILN